MFSKGTLNNTFIQTRSYTTWFSYGKNGIEFAAQRRDCHQQPLHGILKSAIIFYSFSPRMPSRVFVHIRSSGGNEQLGLCDMISEQTLQALSIPGERPISGTINEPTHKVWPQGQNNSRLASYSLLMMPYLLINAIGSRLVVQIQPLFNMSLESILKWTKTVLGMFNSKRSK